MKKIPTVLDAAKDKVFKEEIEATKKAQEAAGQWTYNYNSNADSYSITYTVGNSNAPIYVVIPGNII